MPTPWENEQWYLNAFNDLLGEHVASTMVGTRVIVGTVSTVLLAANTSRKYALITNNSGATLYINYGTAAVLNEGMRLNSNGGNFEINWSNLCRDQIRGINSAVAGTVLVIEGT